MTAPAIWPGTDLESIVFSDEEPRPGCEFRGCYAEALYAGIYTPITGICRRHLRVLYCLAHKDTILERLRKYGTLRCPVCLGNPRLELVRLEPLR